MAIGPTLRSFFGFSSEAPKTPLKTTEVGSPGFSVYGGYVQDKNTNDLMSGSTKWTTYSDIVVNTSIVAAGIRSFMNLIQRTEWSVEPAKDIDGEDSSDAAKEAAEFFESVMHDMETSWSKIMTKASAFKFNGFSWAEWTAKKRDDGLYGLDDIKVRPCHTIDRWDFDPKTYKLNGVVQRDPNTSREIYLPRWKSLYLVDDLLTDLPTGLGLLRHVVDPSRTLKEYLRNEGMGIQRDLRGIPIGRAPIEYLNQLVKDGSIDDKRRNSLLNDMRDLVRIQSKAENTGVVLDSSPYYSQQEGGFNVSAVQKWSVDMLQGGVNGIADTGAAIDRLNREMARILGVEHLMLGDGGGSRALSEDKTRNFFLQMEGTLSDVAEGTEKDIVDTIWALNSLDNRLKPTLRYEAVQFKDVAKIAATLRDMATAGAVLSPNDPAIDDVRQLLGLSNQPDADLTMDQKQDYLDPGEPDPDLIVDLNDQSGV